MKQCDVEDKNLLKCTLRLYDWSMIFWCFMIFSWYSPQSTGILRDISAQFINILYLFCILLYKYSRCKYNPVSSLKRWYISPDHKRTLARDAAQTTAKQQQSLTAQPAQRRRHRDHVYLRWSHAQKVRLQHQARASEPDGGWYLPEERNNRCISSIIINHCFIIIIVIIVIIIIIVIINIIITQ